MLEQHRMWWSCQWFQCSSLNQLLWIGSKIQEMRKKNSSAHIQKLASISSEFISRHNSHLRPRTQFHSHHIKNVFSIITIFYCIKYLHFNQNRAGGTAWLRGWLAMCSQAAMRQQKKEWKLEKKKNHTRRNQAEKEREASRSKWKRDVDWKWINWLRREDFSNWQIKKEEEIKLHTEIFFELNFPPSSIFHSNPPNSRCVCNNTNSIRRVMLLSVSLVRRKREGNGKKSANNS